MKRLLILIFVLVSIQGSAQVPGELGESTIRVINYDPSTSYILHVYQDNILSYTDTIQPGTNITYFVNSSYYFKLKVIHGKSKKTCYPEEASSLDIDAHGRFRVRLNYLLRLYKTLPISRA